MKIAIDMGGTNIKISMYEGGSTEAVWFESIPAHSEKGVAQALKRTADVIRAHGCEKPEIVGIATPGIVDSVNRRVTYINGKYADAVDFDFTAWCEKTFGCPLVMINDANAALQGEVSYGCAKGCENAALLILGTGVGTAAIMEGRPVRGVHNQAGILGGHFIVNPTGRGCTCGGVGCLETYAGSREIICQAESERDHTKSMIFEERPVTMKGIIACWEKGDAFAAKIMNMAIGYYAAAAANLIRAYDPECVILSGGITHNPKIVEAIEAIVKRQGWLPWGVPKFVHAQNPDRSVSMGILKEMNSYVNP